MHSIADLARHQGFPEGLKKKWFLLCFLEVVFGDVVCSVYPSSKELVFLSSEADFGLCCED